MIENSTLGRLLTLDSGLVLAANRSNYEMNISPRNFQTRVELKPGIWSENASIKPQYRKVYGSGKHKSPNAIRR